MLSSMRRIVNRGQGKMWSRSMGSAQLRSGVFKEKSFKEAWLSDAGAYPVMSLFILAGVLVPSFGLYYMFRSPDVRLIGHSRKQFLRGDLAEEYSRPE